MSRPELRAQIGGRLARPGVAVAVAVSVPAIGAAAVLAERFARTDPGLTLPGVGAGRAVLHWVLFATLLLVVVAVPAFASGGTPRDDRDEPRRRRSRSRRPPAGLLARLVSPAVLLATMAAVSVPYALLASSMGGIGVAEIARGYGMILLTGGALAAFAAGITALLRNRALALVIAYAVIAVLVAGTAVATDLARDDPAPSATDNALLSLNPFAALGATLTAGEPPRSVAGPFDAVARRLDAIGAVGGRSAHHDLARQAAVRYAVIAAIGLLLAGASGILRRPAGLAGPPLESAADADAEGRAP